MEQSRLDTLPSAAWKRFFKRFDEHFELPLPEWEPVHFIGYIYYNYKEIKNQEIIIDVSKPPSKSVALHVIKHIIGSLGTANPLKCKEYIDWVFETKIKTSNRHFAITIFRTQKFIVEFVNYRSIHKKISPATPLPLNFQAIAKAMDIQAETYGDVAFIHMATEGTNDKNDNNYLFIKNLEIMGFDFKDLKEMSNS